jgi:phosphohistidine phosphatase
MRVVRVFCDLHPMKRLFIVRHGKAEPHGSRPDFERDLAPRGIQDVQQLGAWCAPARHPGAPMCVSPSNRTLQTGLLLLSAWQEPESAMSLEPEAYLASDRAWLRWVNAWDDQADSGWLVGHNPGLSELVDRLTDQTIWLPTSGMAEIELHVQRWAEVFAGTGRLRGLFTPKSQLLP